MNDLVRELIASIDPQSLLQRIVEQVCLRMPTASGASVALRTPGDFLEVLATYGVTGTVQGRVVPIDDTFQVYPLVSGQPEIIHDTATDDRLKPQVRELSRQLGVRSCLSIPLLSEGSAIGTLSVVAPEPHAFDAYDIGPVSAVTEFLGVLISANNKRRLQRHRGDRLTREAERTVTVVAGHHGDPGTEMTEHAAHRRRIGHQQVRVRGHGSPW